ncbi:hypothetical protein E2C01_041520 [Portunus trituberculatus]|uniref:Uncharacterized protein n=1 Tax=Portunus trituberculatus TaxID=210409 RepID=A0A5B7FRW5_PORTR|nr:hypothetical protein [Portunus trituberculatus]
MGEPSAGNAVVTMTLDRCVREDHCLFYGPGRCPTSKQCLAHLQAVQQQELQQNKAHSLLDIKRKMRGILLGTFLSHKSQPQGQPPSKASQP